jgi:hypothetical protein
MSVHDRNPPFSEGTPARKDVHGCAMLEALNSEDVGPWESATDGFEESARRRHPRHIVRSAISDKVRYSY